MSGRISYYGNIIRNSLVFHFDAAKFASYPTYGTRWDDLNGSGNYATLINSPTFSKDGGGCIVLDGVNTYIPTNVTTNYNVFTVSAWVKPSVGTSVDNGYILNKNSYWASTTNSWPTAFGVSQDGKTGSFFVNNGTCYSLSCGAMVTGATTVNSWNYISATYDMSNVKFYVNGVLTENKSFNSSLPSTAFAWTIGRSSIQHRGGVGGTFYKGSVNNIMLYSRALSSSEILQNYNATKGRFGL